MRRLSDRIQSMYIYEIENWPNFHWDDTLLSHSLLSVRHNQGKLLGKMEAFGFSFQQESFLKVLTDDIVKSTEIEGEFLDDSLVRSSIARHLRIDIGDSGGIDRNVEGIVEMTLDATQNYDFPLSKECLWQWHSFLFPIEIPRFKKMTVAGWRKEDVQVISGFRDKEKVHFDAPSAEKVDDEMTKFLDWFNCNVHIDPLIKASIAHLWFVTIHPFDDGNGRIARVLADMQLARAEKSSQRFYSMSAQIQAERKGYYAILEKTQKSSLDITPWLNWFFTCMLHALERSESALECVLHKTQFWNALKEISLNPRQNKLINRLLEGFEGNLTTSKWAKIAHCSQDTAYRDILDLIEKKILVKNPASGRSTSYTLNEISL